MLGARRNQDLIRRIIESVVVGELVNNGFFKRRRSIHCRVLGIARAQGGDSGFLDMVRGIEIRLAGAKADDILALLAQFAGTAGYGQRGGGFDRVDAAGQGYLGHGRSFIDGFSG